MPKLSQNEWYIRRATHDIATMLDLPEEVVRAVLEALPLHMLDELREQSEQNDGTAEKCSIELPLIGTLELYPMKYPDKPDSILQGRAFRPRFVIKEDFLLKLRYAYYAQKNYLLERVTKNFKGMFDKHFTSLIYREDGDENE